MYNFFYRFSENTITLSGNPGYNINSNIISGLNISDGLMAFTPSPKVWSISRSSLCKSTPLKPIKFLKESQSGCLVYLTKVR